MLPRPLRYAAVAAVGGRVLIAGGTSGVTAERAILSFDPATRAVRQIGELPYPVTHAAGAALNGWLLRARRARRQPLRAALVDPRGRSRQRRGAAGRDVCPQALSDIGAASLAGRIVRGRRPRRGRGRVTTAR